MGRAHVRVDMVDLWLNEAFRFLVHLFTKLIEQKDKKSRGQCSYKKIINLSFKVAQIIFYRLRRNCCFVRQLFSQQNTNLLRKTLRVCETRKTLSALDIWTTKFVLYEMVISYKCCMTVVSSCREIFGQVLYRAKP